MIPPFITATSNLAGSTGPGKVIWPKGNLLKAERAVVGCVAHQQYDLVACLGRRIHGCAQERLAKSPVLEVG